MENIKPGSILINTTTNKLYGVLVSILPNNKIIVFRLDKNTHPIFSKLDIHPHITKVGIINEFQYSTLKNALLKYYRTYTLTPSEKKMMQPLMEFAFPIGIPEYQPNIELPERDIELMDLHSKLISGNRIMINTPNKSCYSHLNNKTVDIIEKTDNGIWVNLPTNEQDTSKLGNSMSFLFYKNKEAPTFGGISRITPIYNSDNSDGENCSINNGITDKSEQSNHNEISNQNNTTIIDAYKKLRENDELTTMMEFNGDKVRLIPTTRKVIFPDVYQNMIYNPHMDTFTIEKENITSALSNKLGNRLIISGADCKGNQIDIPGMGMDNELLFKNSSNKYSNYNDNNSVIKVNINEDGELVYEGGGKKTKSSESFSNNNDNTHINNDNDIEEIDNYEKSISKYKVLYKFLDDDDNYDNDNYDDDYNDNDEIDNKNDFFNNLINDIDESDDNDDTETKETKKEKQLERANRKRLLSNNTNTDSEYDENEFEDIIDEDNVEIQDTFEKVKKVELGELEKVYKESIQKGDLLKYKLEKLPVFKRNNPEIINNIKKEINIISLLKHNITETINTNTRDSDSDSDSNSNSNSDSDRGNKFIKFKQQDYKPLVSKYIKGDFTNKYLIPLVINRKKIYLNKDKKIDKDEYDIESNEIIEDFYETIKNISYIQDKKNVSLNNDVYTQKIINELNPTSINESDSLGMLFRLGDKLDSTDYSKLSQDSITIKYCDKPMKCNSYGLNTMNFDYQVNLGPMGRYISSEDDNDNGVNLNGSNDGIGGDGGDGGDGNGGNGGSGSKNEDNGDNDDDNDDNDGNDNKYKKSKDTNILYSKPKFKIYYPGDFIRIIGYVRPPLSYFDISNHKSETKLDTKLDTKIDNTILNNLYKSQKQKNDVITINLEDINPELINSDNDGDNDDDGDDGDNDNDDGDDDGNSSSSQFEISQHPDKFILFLMPKEGFKYNDIEKQLEKIIPSMDDILKLYFNKIENKSIENISNILNKFEYDYNELTFDMYNKIIKENEEYTKLYTEFNHKIQSKFEIYKKKVRQNKKLREDNEKKYKNRIIRDDDKKDTYDFKYITNDVMDDISNFYFNAYDNKDISIDADEIRIKWFQKNFDNGRFLFKTLLINYLKMYKDTHNLENLETEFAIIKEKHIMMSNNVNMMGQQSATQTSINQLKTKNTSPNIIKYPSLERLEKDNGKVAIDSDGNVIMSGDYALVDVNNTKELYKREVIGNIDMWIKEDMSILYKLIQDKRNNCIENPELKLEEANMYDFDMDRLKCIPKDAMETSIENMSEQHKVELQINELQKEIDYIKNIPILIANLNKEIINDRMVLVNKVNSMKKYMKYIEEVTKKEDELIKLTIQTVKPCIHFKIVDHFHKIKSDYEKYSFANNILNQFENTDIINEIGNENDYRYFHKKDNNKNFTYCNICNQHLLCNHHKLIVSYLNNTNDNNHDNHGNHNNHDNMNNIDYNKIIDIYGIEQNGSYVCSACSITIQTTEILDIEEFAKGEDGGIVKTREITKDISINEKQKEYINNIINTLFEEDEANKDSLKQRITIFKLMKTLSNLEMLSIKDEVDMLNFLKSYQFDKKDAIVFAIQSKIGSGNLQLLKKLVEKTYLNHLIADIGVRFLITLQTTTFNYKLNNKFANKMINETYNKECNTNIIGYPLINNIDEKDGIHYMMCLFSQIALFPEYTSLSEYKEIQFIEKLKKQVENDNLVKEKIQTSLVFKSKMINNINSFEEYHTNYWREYKPRLEYNEITWHPEKLLNSANLKEITYHNIDKMINVGIENSIYYAINVINKINMVIENSNKSNKPMLLNYCCMEQYNKTKYNYMDYFNKQNSDIPKQTNLFKEVSEILTKIKNIVHNTIHNIIYEPLYKPSQIIFKVQFNITNDEIKDMYLKYIDNGLNKGKVHIYDKYGRCILSNVKKVDIESQSYSMQDYKRIEASVNLGNQVMISKTADTPINIFQIEKNKIDELITKLPKLEVLTYLKDFFNKIKESENEIFSGDNENKDNKLEKYKGSSSGGGGSGGNKDKFDIHKHLGYLNANIDNEINNLVRKITTDKNINIYKKIMSNLGDFKELYKDYKHINSNDLNIDEKSDLFRNNKKEDYLQFSIKFLNDVINQIKHNKLSNPLNKDKIRNQYRDFLEFGEKDKLFKILGIQTREIYDFVKILKSKQKYKVLFPELVANVLQYLNIISLSNLFNILNVNKMNKKDTEMIDYNFKITDVPNNEIIDLNKEINLRLDEEDSLDADNNDEEINFIESFELKNSINLKVISEFIITYLNYIKKNQETYDELTDKRIKNEITAFDQKRIEKTLNAFKILKEEGNEETRMLLYAQMNAFKKINYSNIAENVEKLFDNDMNDIYVKNENSGDSVDTYDENPDLNEEYVPGEYDNDNYYENEQMGQVISRDDDEGDQDYNMIAVDDD
jgi:hypothetical protein